MLHLSGSYAKHPYPDPNYNQNINVIIHRVAAQAIDTGSALLRKNKISNIVNLKSKLLFVLV